MNKYTHAIDALPVAHYWTNPNNPLYIRRAFIRDINSKMYNEIIAHGNQLFYYGFQTLVNEEYVNFRITLLALIANMSDQDLIELELI